MASLPRSQAVECGLPLASNHYSSCGKFFTLLFSSPSKIPLNPANSHRRFDCSVTIFDRGSIVLIAHSLFGVERVLSVPLIDQPRCWPSSVDHLLVVRLEAMSLGCLVCHSMDGPRDSFRTYSISSSDGEGRCGAVVTCLVRKVTAPGSAGRTSASKVSPAPIIESGQGVQGTPRLVRSRAVTRDLVRDWNFDEFPVES